MTVIASIKRRLGSRSSKLGALTLAAGLGYVVHAARAGGIPQQGALVYSGVLTLANGTPMASPQDIEIALWTAVSSGTQECIGSFPATTLDGNGRFQVTMPDNCATAVGTYPNLYVEVKVGTTTLGRSPIGAVPYAIEANNASRLDGLTSDNYAPTAHDHSWADLTSDVPAGFADGVDNNTTYTGATGLVPAGMIGLFASSCPSGWLLCNGTSGTPNLVGAYPKGGTAFAAATGSNGHSHSLSLSSSSAGAHTHALTIAAAGAHSHVVNMTWASGRLFGNLDDTNVSWTANWRTDAFISATEGGSFPMTDGPITDTVADHTHSGSTATSAGAHTHPISGTASTDNHEPVHATVVFCMKGP